MMIMNCNKCKNILEGEWSFCPFCGAKIAKGFKLKFNIPGFSTKSDVNEEFEDMHKEMEEHADDMNKQIENMFKAFGFPGKVNVQIRTLGSEEFKPIVMHGGQTRAERPVEATQTLPKVKEMLEPITKETKMAKGKKYVLALPGVKSTADINIKQFSESLEVRAYAGERGYFKVIPIPQHHEIVEKKFQDGFLKIVIAKA